MSFVVLTGHKNSHFMIFYVLILYIQIVLFINAQNAPYTILDEKSIMISRCEPNWSAGNDIKIERENNCFIEVIINPLLARVMSK